MNKIAPYQILFPIGILNSLLAVGVWLLSVSTTSFITHAIFIHPKLILGGFLWSFVLGFLMTAVPRMTGTKAASPLELTVAVTLIFIGMIFAFLIDGRWFYGNLIAITLFLFIYGLKRILYTKKSMPIFFSHIGLGVLLACAGSYSYFVGDNLLGFHLLHVGAILLLVLGIGTRFFSFLSGLPSEFEGVSNFKKLLFHFLGISVATLLYLAGKSNPWAYLVLSLISLYYITFVWRIFRKASRESALKYGVRVVALVIPLSFALCWLLPLYYISWFHILFMGCFSLLTYAVATRVTLAHGAYSIDLESQTKSLWAFLICLLLALFFRVSYGLALEPLKSQLLNFAILFWFISVIIWCYSFLLKIFKRGDQQAPSC